MTYAAIAQQVERILGKDEVASSNLASSSMNHRVIVMRWFCFSLQNWRPHPLREAQLNPEVGGLPRECIRVGHG